MIRFVRLVGSQIADHLPSLAGLRMKIFREYPYLYVGTEAYERDYLRVYVDSPDSMVVLVYDDDRVVGALTTIPFADEHADIKAPFVEQGSDLSRIFYCGEVLLLPEYRGRGLGGRLFKEAEIRARELGRFDLICLCGVKRDDGHPRRPLGYKSLDGFWEKYGYTRRPNLIGTFTWKDLDEEEETPKPMEFWTKELAAAA